MFLFGANKTGFDVDAFKSLLSSEMSPYTLLKVTISLKSRFLSKGILEKNLPLKLCSS